MRTELRDRMRESAPKRALRVLLRALVLLLILLSAACVWASRSYRNVSMQEVLFYLRMPLRGTARQFTNALLKWVFLPAGLAAAALFFLWIPRRRERWLAGRRGFSVLPLRLPLPALLLLIAVWLSALLPAGDRLLDIRGWAESVVHQSDFIEKNYADPTKTAIVFPEKKRNLITIYIESAETTNQDEASGGVMRENHMPELTRLARENVSFSRTEAFEGAAVAPACGWTVAGMVAQSAGIPLKLYEYGAHTVDNMGADFARFLPGAWTLGDVLSAEGYRNVFLCGSDFDFGGRRQFYAQHGAYDIYDYFTAIEDGWIPEDYLYGWGFEDQKMYEFAKRLLAGLQQDSRPFHLGLLTVDTHDPGWLCDLCRDQYAGENIYGRAVRCSSRQAADFVDWCREQPFFENTTIVITGDHASMNRTFYDEYAVRYRKHTGSTERLVYNCFINAAAEPAREKNRLFTTMDIYPTTLAALGCRIEGERLGLGTNLFSGEETLSERYGETEMFSELNRRSLFYENRLLYP